MISDPLGDMIARMRNALARRKKTVVSPCSLFRACVLDVLKREGLILGYKVSQVRPQVKELCIELKYFERLPVICSMQRVSKPSRRVYTPVAQMPRVCNGLGVGVLSTSKGVLADHEARAHHVGGELLMTVI